MHPYQLYLAVHVGAATLWVGAACMQALLGLRVVRAGDPARTLAFARDGQWTGLHVFLPTNLLVLASGLLLVYSGSWSLTTLWLDLGLAGFVISITTGAVALKPGWDKAAQLGEQDMTLLHQLVRRVVFVTHVDLGVLTGVMYLMIVKPTVHDPIGLGMGAIAVFVVLLLSRRVLASKPVHAGGMQSASVSRRADPRHGATT